MEKRSRVCFFIAASVLFFNSLDHQSVLITKWEARVALIYKDLFWTNEKFKIISQKVIRNWTNASFNYWSARKDFKQFLGCFCSVPVIWYAMRLLLALLFLSKSSIDGVIILSNTRWTSVLLYLQTCCKINFSKGPNPNHPFLGKSRKIRWKNIPSTILILMVPGRQ